MSILSRLQGDSVPQESFILHKNYTLFWENQKNSETKNTVGTENKYLQSLFSLSPDFVMTGHLHSNFISTEHRKKKKDFCKT